MLGMKSIGWGIIGCGNVTERKSGPALQKAVGSSLVAVMRRDRAKAEDYARRHGVPAFYDDVSALIADPAVDAVYVATPPSTHAALAMQAARAGKPVYVEKPLAPTLADCDELNAVCRRAGVPLFVAYYRRALPRFLKIRALLEEGAIGEIRLVQVQHFRRPGEGTPAVLPWRQNSAIGGGGLFVDLGSHTLDLLDFLLGPIAECHGGAANQSRQYSAEDIVAGRFSFASGVLGTGLWCFSAGLDRDVNEIIGSRGRIRFSTFGSDPVVMEREGERQEWEFTDPEHIQQPLIQTVVDDLLHGGDSCPSTGVSAARTSRVMDAFLREYREGAAQGMTGL